jgi:gluconate 2-dehydrogenase subunit 3-like protein
MKRRRFVQSLAAVPAAALAQQPAPPAAPAAQTPQAAGGRGGGRFAQDIPKLEFSDPNLAGQPVARFFTAQQFAALRRLSDLLMPRMGANPGALDAGAPEFLDFLIGVSPPDRQRLYRDGLDLLHNRAKKQFSKSFAELDAAQADKIIRPLMVPVPWVKEPPKDPALHFMSAAHEDIRTATHNSREWSAAVEASGRRGGFGGGGQYVLPIDPIQRG